MTKDQAKRSADAFSNIANPVRILMIKVMANGETSVGMLADRLGLSTSAASQHLKKLKETGILVQRKHAQYRYYKLDPRSSHAFLKLISLAEEREPQPSGRKWRLDRRSNTR
ncbi:metalloregulator ArsR/SmtB family transcription factor [Rhizobium sp. PP-F2F-G48]|uniref:ArsR/SmtB family transcription factor n=1 Tax=Rhizobium sp. PP-F2F-G48 TaxID=2135651 RepID=UPI001049D192|nr:metalloregulator ArsR/SmtB family transcription factor [Rhizobium sp. PP-F2F-G48]